MKSLCVYCSSSDRLDPKYFAAATQVGAEMARRDWTLVYGGGKTGLMGAVARGVKSNGGRVICVGTTSMRTLESAGVDGKLAAGSAETTLFVTPGYQFKLVDCLVTNFHLPKSTLLMLVSAFAGYDEIRAAYAHAITQKYRFFSYGDAMFLSRRLD